MSTENPANAPSEANVPEETKAPDAASSASNGAPVVELPFQAEVQQVLHLV
ncbi:MAG: hypothetical protein L6Q76_15465 [Polyangiaceae bacterium]|nr:hypothetical protein [Polyangiaceae bacterium]